MDNGTTTFGLDRKRLAKVLGIGLWSDEDNGQPSAEAVAELLRARFAGPLPLETAVVEALPTLMGKLCQELLPLGGKPLKDVLLDETTPLPIVEKIKDYGKKLAKRTEPDRTVGTTIYYAAIASALVHHGQKITRHPYAYLRDSFDALNKDWMPGDLARHIMKARQVCKERA